MSVGNYISSINASLDRIMQASRDLPEEILRWKPAEDKWSIMEVLCHVEEATLYWLDEIRKLVQSPGSEWGRGIQDEQRLAAVAAAGQRSLADVLKGIEASKAKVKETLEKLTEEQLKAEAPSRNPRFGTKPLSFVIEHLLVEHMDTHDKQIQRNLAQYKDAQSAK